MHYQTRLLPVDETDGFLLAIHHGTHAIGGEDTRETAYARLATGCAGHLENLVDITAHCLPQRPACPSAARYLKKLAKGQASLAQSGAYAPSASEYYADNERRMIHASQLAGIDGVRVPRNVFASPAGKVLLAFSPSMMETSRESLPGLLRLIDLPVGNSIGEWKSSRSPMDRPGKGAQRFSGFNIGRPLAFSDDGERVLLMNPQERGMPRVVECGLDAGLSEIAQKEALHATTFLSCQGGWIELSEGRAVWMKPGLKALAECRLPRGAIDWGASATRDGRLVALPASVGGDIFVVSREDGKARRFSPHRGVRRDEFAQICLSDCGGWLASYCNRKVMLTRLADGVSWPASELEAWSLQDASFGNYVIRSSVPATMAWIGPHLLAVQHGEVRELSLAEGTGTFVSEQGRPGARKPIRVKRSMDFDTLLQKARLQKFSSSLARLHSPAVQIKTKPLKKSGWGMPSAHRGPPLGASRIGGWPDLPAGVDWPTWQDRPMAFLAQVDLAEAHAVQPELRLPSSGLLSFFLGCSPDTYSKDDDERRRFMMDIMVGTEVLDGTAWRVLHHTNVVNLERRTCLHDPLPELVEPCALRFSARGLELPDEHCVAYDQLGNAMSPTEHDDYNELIGQLQLNDEYASDQLMGYPQLIQSTPPEMMCELAARGMDPWNYPDPTSADYPELAEAASEWTLLLQLTSNSHADFCWGDAGHFYFYGRRDAIARGDFSQVWVNFEN